MMHLIGVAYSDDQSMAWTDVSMKLSYFVFPVYFLLNSSVDSWKLLKWFAYVGALSALLGLIVLGVRLGFMDINPLINESDFSLFLHRSYQATYWELCLVYFLFTLFSNKRFLWLRITIIILLSLSVLLTYSKAGIIVMLLAYSVFVLRLIFKYNYFKAALGSVAVLIAILVTINAITPKPLARFNAMLTNAFQTNNIPKHKDSNKSRLVMWSTSVDIIKEHPIIGVGTGDVNTALRAKNAEKGLPEFVKLNLNAHNQFLNTFVAIGMVGFFLFVGMFVTAFIAVRKHLVSPALGYLVLVGIIVFSLTESAFETQAGIVTFTCLILLMSRKNVDLNSEKSI
jgi:O-antigen ligase